MFGQDAIRAAGSSPLTRGKPCGTGLGHIRPGLIPAHAGKTRSPILWASPRRAHPRSRGENPCSRAGRTTATGSSPLTRGKRGFAGRADEPPGLIPAHAGKTASRTARWCCGRAHPRSRGENLYEAMRDGKVSGSSPLTRGKPGPFGAWRPKLGLIPAHAGKTYREESDELDERAHPRSRGENRGLSSYALDVGGSSPLTRGKRSSPSPRGTSRRLIPAHAGKTRARRHPRGRSRAHPRSRGENVRAGRPSAGARGSSPLTRGKPAHEVPWGRDRGLIPAHAGKTRRPDHFRSSSRAHPRSRGENELIAFATSSLVGSSPLTRGKRAQAVREILTGGLIPAHAGKTES